MVGSLSVCQGNRSPQDRFFQNLLTHGLQCGCHYHFRSQDERFRELVMTCLASIFDIHFANPSPNMSTRSPIAKKTFDIVTNCVDRLPSESCRQGLKMHTLSAKLGGTLFPSIDTGCTNVYDRSLTSKTLFDLL